MDTITLNNNTLKYAEIYAKQHNISVSETIEKGILLLLDKIQKPQEVSTSSEFKDALTYVKMLKAKGGRPIPADENDMGALIEEKYNL